MPSKKIPIEDMPICDVCWESYFDNDEFYEIGVPPRDIIVCEKCFKKVCSYCCEDMPEIGISVNGMVFCSHHCMVEDSRTKKG